MTQHYGFDLGRYTDVNAIPTKLAYKFHEQVRASVEERRVLRWIYEDNYDVFNKLSPYQQRARKLQSECPVESVNKKDYNNDCGSKWLANIIVQRINMTKAYEFSLKVTEEINARMVDRTDFKIEYEFNLAEKRENKRRKELSERRTVLNKANAVFRAGVKAQKAKLLL